MFGSDTIKRDRMDGMNCTRWKEKMILLLTAFKVYYVLEGPQMDVLTEEEQRKRDQDETLSFRGTWTIVVIVALRAQRFRPSVRFLFTRSCSRGNGTGQKPTCYECGSQGHFRKDSPKFKNNNRGTQGGNSTTPAKVYAVGRAGKNPDSNVVTGMSLLNNRYASILFNTGADRSFVSTAFSSQIAITPTTLDHYYDVALADGRLIGLNSILRGCTLNFLNNPFNINLMPVELGSFDAVIGMDWLEKYYAVIVCAEKIVRIP
nr:putative reverse transcriptase domain-containing protein [Tanacetum cinerariifolium]